MEMQTDTVSQLLMANIFNTASHYIVPLMGVLFVIAVLMRVSLFWVIKAELRFAREFANACTFTCEPLLTGKRHASVLFHV